jgi:hypothetical protein
MQTIKTNARFLSPQFPAMPTSVHGLSRPMNLKIPRHIPALLSGEESIQRKRRYLLGQRKTDKSPKSTIAEAAGAP